jgi:hypothetical protein
MEKYEDPIRFWETQSLDHEYAPLKSEIYTPLGSEKYPNEMIAATAKRRKFVIIYISYLYVLKCITDATNEISFFIILQLGTRSSQRKVRKGARHSIHNGAYAVASRLDLPLQHIGTVVSK